MKSWSTPELKLLNKERIRKEIQKRNKITKTEIARHTGLSVATCNTVINEMLRDKEILKVDQAEMSMGRPADRFCYNKDYHHVLGIYVSDERGENQIRYTVADAVGDWLVHDKTNPKEITYDEIEGVVAERMKADPLIKSISVGIPGITNGGVVESCDIASLIGTDLRGGLSRRFEIDVEVRNDMDFLAYGAYYTIYQGQENIAVLYFPKENEGMVGCGFVLNGRVLRGHTKFAGELYCIMEGFGIDRKKQIAMRRNKREFPRYVSQLVLILLSTVDPEEIVLMGEGLTEELLAQVRSYCAGIVTQQHVPRIIADGDYDARYSTGLISASIGRLQFPLSEPL